MEHSIFLDTEKINSIRESLDGRFSQINIIDDSVTPQIIKWLGDFFSYHADLKNGVFIYNENINLQRRAYSLFESKPYLSDFAGDEKEVLTEDEYEDFMLYVSYCEIKGKLHQDNEVLEEEIINDFYSVKLPLLEPILSSVIKGITVKLNNSDKNKKHFEDLKKHIEEFYLKSVRDNNPIEKETQTSKPKELAWHPFHNDDVRDFYLYLESKYDANETKSIFSAFWKFFEIEGLIDIKDKRIKQSYIKWINDRFNFQGEQVITRLQTNTESFNLYDFEKHYDEFEVSKGDNFRFHDFQENSINRTNKKPSSK